MGYLINAIRADIARQREIIKEVPKGASYELLSSLELDSNVVCAALCRVEEASLPEGSEERFEAGGAAARYTLDATRVGALQYRRHENDGTKELTRVCASKEQLIAALVERLR